MYAGQLRHLHTSILAALERHHDLAFSMSTGPDTRETTNQVEGSVICEHATSIWSAAALNRNSKRSASMLTESSDEIAVILISKWHSG